MDIVQDIEVKACGRVWWVPRELGLLRRVEQAFGAIKPFAERLGKGHCTHDELLGLYSILLRDDPSAPSRQEIEDWLWRAGTQTPAAVLAMPVFTLGMSEAECAELQRAQNRAAEQRASRNESDGSGPFVPTGAPTGHSSSSSRH